MKRFPLLVAISLLFSWSAHPDESWPQFRGPTCQGISNATGLPLKWSESEHVTWKTAIHGKAWSSPVVFGTQVWLTTASEALYVERCAMCHDGGAPRAAGRGALARLPADTVERRFRLRWTDRTGTGGGPAMSSTASRTSGWRGCRPPTCRA
jgi:hypothetical protein